MNPTHLINPKTGDTFIWTEFLAARGDLLPHDPKAKAAPVDEVAVSAKAEQINAFEDKSKLIEFAEEFYGVKLSAKYSLGNLKTQLIEIVDEQ